MYRRRYSGRYRKSAKQNYQVERPFFQINETGPGGNHVVIPASNVSGVRKVKNFSIEFNRASGQSILVWALVYVPAGYGPNALILTGTDITTMYKPTQNVIMAGMYDPSDPATTARKSTRLSRLLKEGDCVALVYSTTAAINFRFIVTYAITV